MAKQLSGDALQLRSMVKQDGTLELSLATIPIPQPKAGEVLVRVEASPINPSDLGLLFGAAEIKTTFASRYTREVSLAEALTLEAISVYGKQATGEKYLINPNKGLT